MHFCSWKNLKRIYPSQRELAKIILHLSFHNSCQNSSYIPFNKCFNIIFFSKILYISSTSLFPKENTESFSFFLHSSLVKNPLVSRSCFISQKITCLNLRFHGELSKSPTKYKKERKKEKKEEEKGIKTCIGIIIKKTRKYDYSLYANLFKYTR